ncbi:MAG: HAD hydrolase-like protein [Candidatus Promineifilaceae bacterium]
MKLLLFDIDGTLIHANGAGIQILVRALQDVFGTTGPVDSYDMGGKTDTRIITDLMSAAAIPAPEIQSQLLTVFAQMVTYSQMLEGKVTLCPGVTPLLAALQGRDDVLLGLLTGNTEQMAPLKIAAAGLDPSLFQVGAYGCQHYDRDQLPALAMQRATHLARQPIAGHDTLIIGDTPLDIQCARAGGAKAVAVATGRYSTHTLKQYNPDFLFADLTDTTTILEALDLF